MTIPRLRSLDAPSHTCRLLLLAGIWLFALPAVSLAEPPRTEDPLPDGTAAARKFMAGLRHPPGL